MERRLQREASTRGVRPRFNTVRPGIAASTFSSYDQSAARLLLESPASPESAAASPASPQSTPGRRLPRRPPPPPNRLPAAASPKAAASAELTPGRRLRLLREHLKRLAGIDLQILSTQVTQSTDFTELVNQEPWLSSMKLVVKPDMLFGKRGKSGLVALNLDLAQVCQFVKERLGVEVEMGGCKAPITTFIVEPFVPHDQEYYLSIVSERLGCTISFLECGGIEIEENWDKVKTIFLPTEKQMTPEACAPLIATLPLEVRTKIGDFIRGVFSVFQGLAKRVGARFLLTSTSEVYGDPLEHPQKESYWGHVNPIGVRSCYDEGKRTTETLTMDYHRGAGVEERERKEREELEKKLEEDRKKAEESRMKEAMEQQQKELERYQELERLQKKREEAMKRKQMEEEQQKQNQMKLLGKNKSRPKLSFAFGM